MIKLGKKLLILTLSGILTSAAFCPSAVDAANSDLTLETSSGTFTYTTADNAITITGYTGSAGVLDIPTLFSEVTTDTLTISNIGNRAFYDNDALSKVILPSTVTTIDTSAFSNCDGLTTVSFDSNTSALSSINGYAFYNCTQLANFTFPDSLSSIGECSFYRTALKSVTIPASCQTIGEKAFYKTASLTSLTIADGDTSLSLGSSVFCRSSITSVTIPSRMAGTDGTIAIPESMFASCEQLSSVTIPDNCITIGASAFSYCEALTSINLPEQLKTISDTAFRGSGLTNITIPESVTTINSHAFANCSNMGIVDFEGNPATIAGNAFTGSSQNTIFYCEQEASNVIAQANAYGYPYQYHTKALSFASEETKPSTMEYYYGNALDYTTGLKLTANLTADPDNSWTLDDTAIANCTVTGFDKNKVGKQTITIAYGGAKVTYDVHVYYSIEKNISVSSYYNGTYNPDTPYEPVPTITNTINQKTLKEDTHYNVKYANSDKAGTATITITGIESGNYKGTKSVTYTINKKSLWDDDVIATVNAKTYTGSQIKPSLDDITLTYGNTTLTRGVDYQLRESSTYGENVNAGTGIIIIEGLGNYTNGQELSFKINKKSLTDEDIVVEYDDTTTYTGSAQTPAVTVKYGDLVLTNGTDYTVSYKNNTAAGKGTIIINAVEDTLYSISNYSGSIEKNFTIEPAPLTADMITVSDEVVYTGNAATPEVNVVFNETTLTKDTDYTVTCESVNVGKGTVAIEGTGNFKETITKEFNITAKSLENATFSDIASIDYTGEAIEPTDFTVTLDNTTLEADKDYTIAYENNINSGEATVIITGIGNYTGTATSTFRIVGINISASQEGDEGEGTVTSPITVTLVENSIIYTGSELCPAVTVTCTSGETSEELVENTDYTISYENNVNCGTATIIVNGCGKYEGTLRSEFEITAADITTVADITVGVADTTYTGEAITPEVIVVTKDGLNWLEENLDYTVSYDNSINAGKASITINGINNYSGTVTKEFVISQKDISGLAAISGIPASVRYEGNPVTLDLTIGLGTTTLTEDTDYELSYANNDRPGTATVTIAFTGNYTGSITRSFNILATDITTANVSGIADAIYTGSPVTHDIAVTFDDITLKEDTDYTVSYKDNTEIGTATVTITGINAYTGVITKTFNIAATDISAATVSGISNSVYTGSPITYELTIKLNNSTLVEDTDYSVTYANNENAGTATVTITGIGKYVGTIKKSFTITPATITAEHVTLDTSEKVYAAKQPNIDLEITVADETLTEGKDYTLSFKNQTKPGVATVTIKGIGNYTGTITKKFTITPKKMKITSTKNKKGKKLEVKWKKQSGVAGYEVSIATKKNFKKGKIVKNTKSASYTFKKLSKKTYYVRIRAYVKVNGKKVYSPYSSVKTVKIKK